MELDDATVKGWLNKLQAELDAVAQTGEDAAATVELDQGKVGRLSRMDALQAQAMAQATQRARDAQRLKLKQAWARLAAGDYGYCERCGQAINPQRLAVDPTAPCCIECAQ